MRVYIKTYGCQMNVYDSEKILAILGQSHQAQKADKPEDADLLLLNTCSIREKAEDKVYSELGRLVKLKEKNKDIMIGVGGCVASQEGENLLKRAPYVDLVFGPQSIHKLPDMIEAVQKQQKPQLNIAFTPIAKFDELPPSKAEGPCAYISIMEGCSKWCSYCIVPYTRGEEVSRPLDDVLQEVLSLTRQGVKEIHLLGQNVNDYQGSMADGNTASLALLIHYIAAIDAVKRIRFTTSHPTAFSDDLIDAFRDVPKLVNHLHLPIQSGSDRILNLMKRGYTALEFKAKIQKLRAVRPNISLSSDFIVGFPGETDADFQQTMKLIHDVGFDHSFSFIYSKRPGTPAALLDDPIDTATKKQRLHILQARLLGQANTISEAMLDTVVPVLITGPSKKDPTTVSGRTENNRVVHMAGALSDIGKIVNVEIKEVLPNALRGAIV